MRVEVTQALTLAARSSGSDGWVCAAIGIGGFILLVVLSGRGNKSSTPAQPRNATTALPPRPVAPPPPRPPVAPPPPPKPAPPPDIELNEDFKRALDLIHTRRQPAFITGRAGTGKSTLLRYFRAVNEGSLVVLAPTGLAAINVGGQTVHSFFKFKPRFIDVREIRPARDTRIFRQLHTVVIDEVSMVRADLMDGIDHALRINRGDNRPFGGVQVVMFGDPLQLPPIVKENELQRYFAEHHGSPFFFDAHVFNHLPFNFVELRKVYRQKEVQFLEALSNIRDGVNVDAALQLMNTRVVPSANCTDDEITLTTTNARANTINQQRIESIREEAKVYEANVSGKFEESAYPTDRSLPLKRGAKVMMIRNDASRRWVNGTLGIVQELRPRSALIRVGSASYEVQPERWENVKYEYDEVKRRVVPRVVGVFEQMPLRIAYAITIHKSQGQTFDKVCIDLDRGAFAHGQLYVAVSRCRTLEGIRLTQPITVADVIVDDHAKNYRRKFAALAAQANDNGAK